MNRCRVPSSAGVPASGQRTVNLVALVAAYYDRSPDLADPAQRVSFGTSGHRGSSLAATFNEAHVLAITQAICEHRKRHRIDGPLFLGRDTHALSRPAFETALEVLAANGVETMIDDRDGYTPTPAISHAILSHNRGRASLAGRWHRHDAVAQSAGRWRAQVQPPDGRPRRCRGDARDSGSGQRATRERRRARATVRVSTCAARADDARARLPGRLRARPRARSSTWLPLLAPACASASIRSVEPVSPTGIESRSVIACRSRWSMTKSTPLSARCRSTGMAESAWIARRPMRWPTSSR